MERRDADPATWWRPFATVALFSILPFAWFLDANRLEVELDGSLASFVLFLLVPGSLAVGGAGLVRGRVAAERAAVLFAIAAFLFFRFEPIDEAADVLGLAGWGPVALWGLVLAGCLYAGVRLSRHPATWTYALVAGALLTALPSAQYASYRLGAEDTASAGTRATPKLPAGLTPDRDRALPDVYFILLDAYGSRARIRSLTGFDDPGFYRGLEARGFDVADRATTPYNKTILAVPSMLRMDYPLEEGPVGSYDPYYETITGDNPVVGRFDRLGYDFAFATDWPSPGSIECKPSMAACIRPDEALGEREWALLASTPLYAALPELGVTRNDLARKDSLLRAEETVERIDSDRDPDRPLFAYVHLMSSHAPFLYAPDCEPRELASAHPWGDPIDGADTSWGKAGGEGGELYTTAVRCLNDSLLRAVDLITRRDPGAIVVLAGDHGPEWEFDMTAPPREWSAEDIRMRYSVLSAARLPGCPEGRAAANIVNAFRTVFGCIAGRPVKLLPSRRFAVRDGNDQRVTPFPLD